MANKKKSLTVGKIIYLINPNKLDVVPAQVFESVSKNTLEGIKKYHNVKLANGKVFCLEDSDAAYFSTTKEAKTHLLKQAENGINKILERAKEAGDNAFNIASKEEIPLEELPPTPVVAEIEEENTVPVDMGNGQIVNVKLPKELR